MSSPARSPESPPIPLSAAVVLVRNPRARRYVIRVGRGGTVRVTIPRGGSEAAARRFVEEKASWIRTQLIRAAAAAAAPPTRWMPGTEVWYRGEKHPLLIEAGRLRLGGESFPVPPPEADWRAVVEGYLWKLAQLELPDLVYAKAAQHSLNVRRVTVRNQRTRWGSCSRRGTISLNWRIVQTPRLVRDYIVAHELAHLREMNHSHRYWRVVDAIFPEWREAERWLRKYGRQVIG